MENKPNIKMLGDRILIDAEEESTTKTASGIEIAESEGNLSKTSKRGTVIAAGPGAYEYGNLLPMTVKPGDRVLFMFGETVMVDGHMYYLARLSEVHAVLDSKSE